MFVEFIGWRPSLVGWRPLFDQGQVQPDSRAISQVVINVCLLNRGALGILGLTSFV